VTSTTHHATSIRCCEGFAYAELVAEIPNAIVLDDAAVDLPSGLRVIGSTLWSFVDAEEATRITAAPAELVHEGVDMIRIGERLMTWDDATQVHLRARAFIEGEL
jgi:hypothetical protein